MHPLHRNAQTRRLSGAYVGPHRVSLLQHKVPPYPVFSLPVVQKSLFELEVTQDHEGSFLVDDRVYCDYEVQEHASVANQHLPLPLLVVTNVDGAVVTAEIPHELRYEVQLPADVVGGRERLAIRLHPRELNGPYVIVPGDARGTFAQGSTQVTSVSNPNLLQIGDLVNGDFTREGTRIAAIDNDTVTLSQAALQSSTDPQGDPIPAILAT
ncbi:hypothetical protein [Haliangium sp.]|uniref:hypothetical protein n=1 Tax=Haliangium sp. TaxID=2663208 RepID=UPI003D0E121C